MAKEITLREKAAVIYCLVTKEDNNSTFYEIARSVNSKSSKDNKSILGYNLRQQERIKQYYEQAKVILQRFVNTYSDNNILLDNDNLILGEKDTLTLKDIDFTNPESFIKYLNSQANSLTEERDRREYLKLIADLLRFKEGNKTSSEDIQRFYTPLNCKDCAIYKQIAKAQKPE